MWSNMENLYVFLEEIVDLVHKVPLAYKRKSEGIAKERNVSLFDAGYININRQYLYNRSERTGRGAESLQIPIKGLR